MSYTFTDLKKSRLYPVLVVENIIADKKVRLLENMLRAFFSVFLIFILLGAIGGRFPQFGDISALSRLAKTVFFGLALIDLDLLLVFFLLKIYLRSSYYFENVVNNRYRPDDYYTFTVGRILYHTVGDDVLAGFLRSAVGREVLVRAGFLPGEIDQFLAARTPTVSNLTFSGEQVIKLKDLALLLYQENPDLAKLLFARGLNQDNWLEIIDWVVRGIEAAEVAVRWWRPENLSQITPLGRTWSYGSTYTLDLYSHDLLNSPEVNFSAYEVHFHDGEVRQIENILARGAETNVLLIGEDEAVRLDVLWAFAKEIKDGKILASLGHKRLLLFNTNLFLSAFKQRFEFETALLKALGEALRAGDIILIFQDLAALTQGAEALGSNVISLLDQYFASSRLKIIGLTNIDSFHQVLESRSEVMTRFEKVTIVDLNESQVTEALFGLIARLERQHAIIFSYQGLREIVKSASLYITVGNLAEKARGLVSEIIPWLNRGGKTLLMADDVLAYIKEKTNIPVGAISGEEQGILANLETVLHSRVIGQRQAVTDVANALKRARAGTASQSRPLGSFLFLGPTGVGKTETAKALAFAYFGSEDKLMRLDMTEYQDGDSVRRLIGSFDENKPGVLANLIRQNPFGVFLLDEFEKTTPEVKNLFLQILDEGLFSDMNGKKINARNLIFIATSNAGAQTIWQLVEQGLDPQTKKDSILNEIITSGTYKPELLNRFDDVVLFHPLSADDLKKIAGLMLAKLAKRLAAKGIDLVVNDYLCGIVAASGAGHQFGARPMNRYIQDTIEQAIANHIIAGDIKSGNRIEFIPHPEAGPATAGELSLKIM